MPSIDAIQVAERLGRLEERGAALALNAAAQLDVLKVSSTLQFDVLKKDIADLKGDVAGIKDIVSEGRGMGRIASFIWPPIGGFIAAAIATFMGLK